MNKIGLPKRLLKRLLKYGMELSSAEGGRRRDEPGKENVELKNCIALVVIKFARASLRARRALGRLAGAR